MRGDTVSQSYLGDWLLQHRRADGGVLQGHLFHHAVVERNVRSWNSNRCVRCGATGVLLAPCGACLGCWR